ncbi:PQQ-binding-like beta-propeller repeat protein [Streptomyces sp. NPDC004539]|uniref:outer membrane protein assembly factor BamB family protein n=1 Tax=Streptomyces sp. NPDC004539 TaxID=3154280 RepID=UPI0033AE122B
MTQPPQGPPPGNPPHQPPNQPPPFAPPGSPQPQPQNPPPAPPQPPAYGAPQGPPQPQSPPQPPASSHPQGPPPAYGAPHTPPTPQGPPAPPPGYGYPQPSPQPAYGYPAPPQPQSPASYGYPAQQPTYGQPSPPTAPMQAQAGGKDGLKAQIAIVASALVAMALIIGGGVWYSNSKSSQNEAKKDDKPSASPTGGAAGGGGAAVEKAPSDPASKVLFQLPIPSLVKGESLDTDGSWVTDKVFAKSGVSEINGYDLDKGTKLWTVKLPGPVCGASRWTGPDGTRTAILFRPAKPTKQTYQQCSQVGALDLAAGKLLWTKTASAGDYALTFDAVTISGTTVAASGTSGGAAFDLTTGKSLWQPKAADTCHDRGYGGGPKLVALRKCGDYDNPVLSAQTLDPLTGKVLSEYKLATGIEYASIISTDPLVVGADVGDSAGDGSALSDLFSIDNKTGQLRARISVPGDDYGAECEISQADGCEGVIAAGDRLYIQTEDSVGSGGSSSAKQIVAFDVVTGKQTGQRADGGEEDLYPLRMDGANLLAYKEASYDKGGEVVSIDGTTFKQTTLMKNPDTRDVVQVESRMSPGLSEILYAKGRLFLSQTFVSASDTDEKLAIAYGTGS